LLKIRHETRFDPADFLAKAGVGRTIVELEPKDTFFSQGDAADTVFYLQRGRAKLTVVSERGKEATITLLSAGDDSWATTFDRLCCQYMRCAQDNAGRDGAGHE
jgi:CRP-like cAMP-binding protein